MGKYRFIYNPITKQLDLVNNDTTITPTGQTGGVVIVDKVDTYSLLPAASGYTGNCYLVLNDEGTSWLPGSLGGTFYAKGVYYSNGSTWVLMSSIPYQATQDETNAGVVDNVFVTPLKLSNYSGFTTYQKVINLTTTGDTGSATFVNNILNIPTYTLAGLSGQTQLSGNGFVRVTGTTIDYITGTSSQFVKADGTLDSNTYLTSVDAYSGTTNRVTVSNYVIDIASGYTGQSSINTVGGIISGSWSGTPISEVYGGTNQTSYNIGDILYASGVNTLTKLPGNQSSSQLFLSSIGTGTGTTIPSWQPLPQLGGLTFYFTNSNSDVPTYYKQSITPQLPLTKLTSVIVTTSNQLLYTFITEPGYPNRNFIPDGQYSAHLHLSATGGTKSLQVRAEVWETDSLGVDIVKIADLGNSEILTNINTEYFISEQTTKKILSSTSSRIAIKLYSTLGSSGSNPSFNIFQGDGSDSRLNLPAPTVDATNYVPYTGATSVLNLGSFDFLTNGRYNNVLITKPVTGATLTLADNSSLITVGGFSTTFTTINTTNVTLPTGGTLSTLSGVEVLTNKTIGVGSQMAESLLTFTDITTNNATTLSHGFLPKLSGIGSQFLNGQGNFSTPTGTTNSYVSTQFSNQTSVSVTTGFGVYPVVQVIDNNGDMLIPLSVTHNVNGNSFVVTFSIPTTGTIIATVGSPQPQTLITVTSNYQVLETDSIVLVTTASSIITLPNAVGNGGKIFTITNGSNGNITVNTLSSQTISGSLTQILLSQDSMDVFSDGTKFYIK